METDKAKPGDTILVKHNSWNASWLIGFEFLVIKQADCGKSDEVTIKTPKGDFFIKHHHYKIVKRAEGTTTFEVGDIVMWEFMGTRERCRIVDKPSDCVDAPNGEVWLQGLEQTSQHRPSHGPTRNLTFLEKGGQTAKKGECCPDCKGTGRIPMLNWDVDCNCVK